MVLIQHAHFLATFQGRPNFLIVWTYKV